MLTKLIVADALKTFHRKQLFNVYTLISS